MAWRLPRQTGPFYADVGYPSIAIRPLHVLTPGKAGSMSAMAILQQLLWFGFEPR
jgi:hypothetical protein